MRSLLLFPLALTAVPALAQVRAVPTQPATERGHSGQGEREQQQGTHRRSGCQQAMTIASRLAHAAYRQPGKRVIQSGDGERRRTQRERRE